MTLQESPWSTIKSSWSRPTATCVRSADGGHMRVKEIMSPKLKAVTPFVAADDAWEMMKAERIHHLVVLDGARIAGVFSSGDAGRSRGKAVREGLRVADLMTERVITIGANAP